MKCIVDYTVINAGSIPELEEGVKDLLPGGWQPLGAPFQGGKDMSWLMQALIKYEED